MAEGGNYRGPWTVELFKIFAVIVIYTGFLTTQKILGKTRVLNWFLDGKY